MPDTHCPICKKPCDEGPRVRDKAGRIFHRDCYDRAKAARQSSPPAARQSSPVSPSATEKLTFLADDESRAESARLAPPPMPAAVTNDCPRCNAGRPVGAVVCVECGFNQATDRVIPTVVKGKRPGKAAGFLQSRVFEVGLFGIGISAFLGLYTLFIIKIISDIPTTGVRTSAGARMVIVVTPWICSALINLVGGILLLVKRTTWALAICYVGAVTVPLLMIGIPLLSGQPLSFNCMTIISILVPVGVVTRGKGAMEEIEAKAHIKS